MAGEDGEEEDQVPAVILGLFLSVALLYHYFSIVFILDAFGVRLEFVTKKLYTTFLSSCLYVPMSYGDN